MKQNDKNTYTGIIRLRDKIKYRSRKYKIIVISEIKLLGCKKDKYSLIWMHDIPEFKYLNVGDVIKFNARVSEERNLKYLTKSNRFDIEELKKIPYLVSVANVSYLDKEKNNKNIKTSYCKQCGVLIYIKQRGKLCNVCWVAMRRSKYDKQKRVQNIINNKIKTCRACGKTYLKVTHFINSKRSKDGYASKCIYC